MNIIFSYLFFFILAFLNFYIPGRLFLYVLKLKENELATQILSWTVGTSLFILLSYFFAAIGFPYLMLVLIVGCLIVYLKKYSFKTVMLNLIQHLKTRKIPIRQLADGMTDWLLVAIIILGSIAFLSLTFSSGIDTPAGRGFLGFNATDGILHLAYIKTQAIIFPPPQPGLAEVPLRGYHFFYDFLLSRFVIFYQFTAEDLHFRLFPLYISLLYGASVLLFAQTFTKDKIALRIILFLAYFGQSTTSIVLPFVDNFDFFGINQPLLLILNPSMVLGLPFLFTGMYLIPKIKDRYAYALLAGLLLGPLAQIKVYAGIIGVGALIVYSLYQMLIKRREFFQSIFRYITAIVLTLALTYLTFLLNTSGNGSLVFAPLLFYEHYMQIPFLQSRQFGTKLIIYQNSHNFLGLILLYLEAVVIFWFVNLGARLIIFAKIKNFFTKTFWTNPPSLVLFFCIIISILIPAFSVQSSSVFDIVQFLWITLVLLSIPAGIAWAEIFAKKVLLLKMLVIVVLGIFSLAGFVYIQQLFVFNKYTRVIPQNDVAVYEAIGQLVPPDQFILLLPDITQDGDRLLVSYNRNPLTAGMTGRPIYYEGEIVPFVQPTLIPQRKKYMNQLIEQLKVCNKVRIHQLLKTIGTSYIVSQAPNDCLQQKDFVGEKVMTSTINFYHMQ